MTSEIWAALIVAASAILVAWMQTRTHKVAKQTRDAAQQTVVQTEQTSNGFARHMKESLKAVEQHLASQDRRRDRFERLAAQQAVNFDNRLVKIEEAVHPATDDDDTETT